MCSRFSFLHLLPKCLNSALLVFQKLHIPYMFLASAMNDTFHVLNVELVCLFIEIDTTIHVTRFLKTEIKTFPLGDCCLLFALGSHS